MEYENEERGYDPVEDRAYDRDDNRDGRELRDDRRGDDDARARSASPDGRERMDTRSGPPSDSKGDDPNTNPGSNLFVTGIHPRLTENDITRLFEKYGEVEKCNIMRDPHSGDSRGFGFVKMVTPEQADAAREALQGHLHEGRTLSIEKARRGRPRTPTPGKYYGPPKRETRGFRGGGRFGGDRYDDRRGGGYGRRDDYGSGPRGARDGARDRYRDRYDDRESYGSRYGTSYRDREDYGRSVDRYASGPPARGEDRYGGGRGDDRRGYYGGREERGYGEGPPRDGGRGEDRRGFFGGREDRGYGEAPPRDGARETYGGGGRGYDDRDTKRT